MRRAIELISRTESNLGRRLPVYADEIDKLQRVSPEPTGCFEVGDIDYENHSLFPPGALDPEENGSIRFIYWNKRQGCVCPYKGTVEPDSALPVVAQYAVGLFGLTSYGWGGQPFPCEPPLLPPAPGIDDCWLGLQGPPAFREPQRRYW